MKAIKTTIIIDGFEQNLGDCERMPDGTRICADPGPVMANLIIKVEDDEGNETITHPCLYLDSAQISHIESFIKQAHKKFAKEHPATETKLPTAVEIINEYCETSFTSVEDIDKDQAIRLLVTVLAVAKGMGL